LAEKPNEKKRSRPRKSKASRDGLDAPDLYINRELSWLEFNDRVLNEGLNQALPLMERLKFLAIVSSNLDEFFMIRVAGLKQQKAAKVRSKDLAGLTATQQLAKIAQRVREMVARQAEGIREAFAALAGEGVYFLSPADLTTNQRSFLDSHFHLEVQPILTPLAMGRLDPQPALPGQTLMLAFRLEPETPRRTDDGEDPAAAPPAESAPAENVAVVPVPAGLPRHIALPAESGLHLVRLEDLIASRAESLFPGYSVRACTPFRITRDADVTVQEDQAGDLLDAIDKAVRARRRRDPVRLEIPAGADWWLRRWLMNWAGLTRQDVYESEGMIDATALMEVAFRPGLERLRDADWPPQRPRDLPDPEEDIWEALAERDVLLEHPYESFSPVVHLLDKAADDPSVLAIKMTLYRTSGDSPIIAALERAAQAGKQVNVLVELKARFDEARNIVWARRLEEAGALVIYGIAGYKTHSKAVLIVRREANRIRRYVHLATGNYNDRTAKLYSDIGLMTTDDDFARDTAAFFNLLTGYSEQVGWMKLAIAPTGIRRKFVELIEREIEASTPDEPGLILAKVNSLHDRNITKALYRASQAGVRVRLNIRGICCLRPGVPGVSDNIEVVSIVDRYLEHARAFYFRNAGHEEVYLSSADWMGRNLDRRLEILFPVQDPKRRRRLISTLKVYFDDNVKAFRLQADGAYVPVQRPGRKVRAQEVLYRQAVDAARANPANRMRFRPVTRPEG
jgi:polyphosphate kinase